MPLKNAKWHQILKVLHESVHIWSSGLSSLDYRRLLILQMQAPWFRRNCRFTIFEGDGDGVLRSSCKLYEFEFLSRGRLYRLAGIGAVYTQLEWRGLSYASDLLDEVIESYEDKNYHELVYDGIILYSEIGTDFYDRFGFEEFGSVDFHITNSVFSTRNNSCSSQTSEFCWDVASNSSSPELLIDRGSPPTSPSLSMEEYEAQRILENSRSLDTTVLNISDIPFLERHYSRWLRSQPFGMIRSETYWQYKILKEDFLHNHSRTGWPPLSLLKVDVDSTCQGYAIVVINAYSIRILEIIGTESARKQIWANLLTQVLKGRIESLDGWEAVIRDFSPTYKIRSLGLENHELYANLEISCTQREWGQGMILCLNPDLQKWLSVNPCPLLELDHH